MTFICVTRKFDFDKLNEQETGYIIGLFMGDGYSYYNENDRHYRVEFHLNFKKDFDISYYLANLLRKVGLNFWTMKDKRGDGLKVYMNSKAFMFWIYENIALLNLKIEDLSYRLGLLSGFIDADGFVELGEIVLSQKDIKTLELFKEVASIFDVDGKIWWNENKKSYGNWRLRIYTRFKYLPHNSIKVGTVYGCLSQRDYIL